MARKARTKNPEGIYHVSSRSINEINMFNDNDDMDYFLSILKMIVCKYEIKIYAYCLMSNHYHILIDTCNYDISKLMKILNLRYVKYINRKYNRRGPLLDGRFYSSAINDMNYLIYVSAYIHNNPKDLPGYRNRESEYKYSSFRYYSKKTNALDNFVDVRIIMNFLDRKSKSKAILLYEKILDYQKRIIDYTEFKDSFDYLKTKSCELPKRKKPKRDYGPEKIIQNLCNKLGMNYTAKNFLNNSDSKSKNIAAYLISIFSTANYETIKMYFGQISQSTYLNMIKKGFDNIRENSILWNKIIQSFYQ
jgi:REP element-mobilizing transposase RayT